MTICRCFHLKMFVTSRTTISFTFMYDDLCFCACWRSELSFRRDFDVGPP